MKPWASAGRHVHPWLPWTGIAIAAGVAGVAGSYIATGLRPAFVGTVFSELVVTYTPGAVTTFAITRLGDLGHVLAFALAIALAVAALAAIAFPSVLALRDGQPRIAGGLSVLPGAVALVLTGDVSSGLGVAGGACLVVGGAWLASHEAADTFSEPRRSLVGAVGTAIGLGIIGISFPGLGKQDEIQHGGNDSSVGRPAAADALTTARERSLDVEGLEPLVSSDFYEVDINTVNPIVGREDWSLQITGAVESERTFDFQDLTERTSEDRFVTLRCVGDELNGEKMGNALWTGVPMRDLLNEATPRGEFVVLHAADDYYNEFPIEALWPGLLAYRMNGQPLPRKHGFPIRALVPGHWGEINVKWLTEIEVRERETEGYWEKRGWHGTGPVHMVAKLWQVNHLDTGRIEVAGHAYAGTRGVKTVEVSVDGGTNWTEAQLSEPLPGKDVWRQWRHEYTAETEHEVVVRTIDRSGTVQPRERNQAYPRGATGWVSELVQPSAAQATTESPDWPG